VAKHVILVSIVEPFTSSVAEARLKSVARRVLEGESVGAAELSITVTDDETVRSLNREYAGEDAVTDVLSFSQREGEEFVAPPGRVPPLGEVIIAYPQAAQQGRGHGRSAEEEVARLLIHGILHLLGYDHAEPEEERRMQAREDELVEATRAAGETMTGRAAPTTLRGEGQRRSALPNCIEAVAKCRRV
jgi:probable rRNA maturation factor